MYNESGYEYNVEETSVEEFMAALRAQRNRLSANESYKLNYLEQFFQQRYGEEPLENSND